MTMIVLDAAAGDGHEGDAMVMMVLTCLEDGGAAMGDDAVKMVMLSWA